MWDALRSQIETIELPYPTVTTDERVRLLTADLDDAKTRYRELRGRISDGTSPAQFHARTMLAELQERADRQRPARIAMLDTRQEWTDREFEAEALWHHIDTINHDRIAVQIPQGNVQDRTPFGFIYRSACKHCRAFASDIRIICQIKQL